MSGSTNKPRVLYVGLVAPPFGGMATSLHNLLNSSLKDSCEFIVLDVTGYRTRHNGPALKGIFYQIKLFFKLIFILIKQKPAIAHFHLKGGFYFYRRAADILICRLFGCKIILQIRGSDFKQFYGQSSHFGKKVIKSILSSADKVITLSKVWEEFIMNISKKKNIVTIPNGIVLSEFCQKNNIREKFGLHDTDTVILFMGGASRRKGLPDILTFVSDKKDFLGQAVFLIAGGPDIGEDETTRNRMDRLLEEAISNQGIKEHIRYIGVIKGQEKIDCFFSSDILLHPSYAENFSNVMLEAFAAGLPVVITDVGGARDAMQDGVNGFIVNPGDLEMLSKKTMLLIGNRELREKMGRENLTLAREKYDMPIIARKIDELYKELLIQ